MKSIGRINDCNEAMNDAVGGPDRPITVGRSMYSCTVRVRSGVGVGRCTDRLSIDESVELIIDLVLVDRWVGSVYQHAESNSRFLMIIAESVVESEVEPVTLVVPYLSARPHADLGR